ncbi:hypothetical protein N7533_009797 [Penicillium manginii]|uniref:uncharacterized protein n=1 Tax=Penicillium manginii TaxID=203109 RepID=UPI00254676DF|nr:uncharacterized protein N7533_009797 [Penicillium manginii]KAJ5744927.1 hypothetical protein N7533_009797 [Penicillium manginii]
MVVASGKGNVSVVVPTPTVDIENYRPFEAAVNHTINRILSDKSIMEEFKEKDWPVYTGSESHDLSPIILSSPSTSLAQHSPSARASPLDVNKTRLRKRPTASRHITRVYMPAESHNEKHVSPATAVTASSRSESSDGQENQDRARHPKVPKTKNKRRPLYDHAEPSNQQDSDLQEEDALFSSLEVLKRHDLIKYIGTHPLLKSSYPLKRSAWRRYVNDVRTTATSFGLSKSLTNRLVRYVHKNYFSTPVGRDAGPSEPDPTVCDEQMANSVSKAKTDRPSRKRSRLSSEHPRAKRAKTQVASPDIGVARDRAVENLPLPSASVSNCSEISSSQTPEFKKAVTFKKADIVKVASTVDDAPTFIDLTFDDSSADEAASTVVHVPPVEDAPTSAHGLPVADAAPVDDVPFVDSASTLDKTLQGDVDDTPIVDDASLVADPSSVADDPTLDDTPIVDVATAVEDVSIVDNASTLDKTLECDDRSSVDDMPSVADIHTVDDAHIDDDAPTVGDSAAGNVHGVEEASKSRKSKSSEKRHVAQSAVSPQNKTHALSAAAGIARKIPPPQLESQITNDQPVAMSKKERRKQNKREKRASQIQQAIDVPGTSHSMLTHRSSKKMIRRRSLVSSALSTDLKRKRDKKKEKARKRRKSEQQQTNANVDTDMESHDHHHTHVAEPAEPAEVSASRPHTPKRQILPSYDQSQILQPSSAHKSPFAVLSPDPTQWEIGEMDF